MNVLACQETADGWRGVNADGEILNVVAREGRARIPQDIIAPRVGIVDSYLARFSRALALYRDNRNSEALIEVDAAIAIADTVRARYNRAMILLALGRWSEGFAEYLECERSSVFIRPYALDAYARGLELWQGAFIAGQRLVLTHDHGYGDTIMALRYLPTLRALGIEAVLMVPTPLHRLVASLAPVVDTFDGARWFCPLLSLLGVFARAPAEVVPQTYLAVDPVLASRWRATLRGERKIGAAWSVGNVVPGDFPRAAPLEIFRRTFGDGLVSVQVQGTAEADWHGVEHFAFDDFADCVALMSVLDRIVTVDTAAVHLAGAIGHPRVDLMLSHWSSWRWQAQWYPTVTVHRQAAPGDWASAFEAMKDRDNARCPNSGHVHHSGRAIDLRGG